MMQYKSLFLKSLILLLLTITSSEFLYAKSNSPQDPLVKITPEEFDVILDLRYATKNNICQKPLYQNSHLYLHKDAAKLLRKATLNAKNLGFKLKIFDGFRPIETQEFMFNFFNSNKDKRAFFSNPATGSVPHCRGVGIDLTLTDLNGRELDMGSDFDELSSLAHHNSKDISKEAAKNRKILRKIMTDAGFDDYSKEWWHYQLHNARKYDILPRN